MKCVKCGSENPDNSKYCGNCGVRLANVLPPPLPNSNKTSLEWNSKNAMKSETNSKSFLLWIVLTIVLFGGGVYFFWSSSIKEQINRKEYVSQESSRNKMLEECQVSVEESPFVSEDVETYEKNTKGIDYDVSGSFCYEGRFFDDDEDNPVRLEFERNGNVITNCMYTNVQLGGKIRMKAEITDYGYIFKGKDGNQDFIMDLHSNYGGTELKGTATVGTKIMNAILNL